MTYKSMGTANMSSSLLGAIHILGDQMARICHRYKSHT